MMVGCEGYGAVVQNLTVMIDARFGLGILRLIQNMEVDSVLALLALAQVTEVHWESLPNQDWLQYDCGRRLLLLRPEKCGKVS